jgi:hypothetical protein
MTNALKTVLAASVLTIAAGGAFANTAQLAASAGLTPAEAQGLSLQEIAGYKAFVENDEWSRVTN